MHKRENKVVLSKNTNFVEDKIVTTAKICINDQCIQFDCRDRVKMRDSDIYCGDERYYKCINNAFVNQRS